MTSESKAHDRPDHLAPPIRRIDAGSIVAVERWTFSIA
jgi:hypothetical protein